MPSACGSWVAAREHRDHTADRERTADSVGGQLLPLGERYRFLCLGLLRLLLGHARMMGQQPFGTGELRRVSGAVVSLQQVMVPATCQWAEQAYEDPVSASGVSGGGSLAVMWVSNSCASRMRGWVG